MARASSEKGMAAPGGSAGGVADGSVAASFCVKEFDGRVVAESGLMVGEIFLDAREELRAEEATLGEQCRKSLIFNYIAGWT